MKLQMPAFALIGLLVAAPLFAAEQTVKFAVPGMYCASCPLSLNPQWAVLMASYR